MFPQGGSNERKEQGGRCTHHFSVAIVRFCSGRDELYSDVGESGGGQTGYEQHTGLRGDREESRRRRPCKAYRSDHLASAAQPEPVRCVNPIALRPDFLQLPSLAETE